MTTFPSLVPNEINFDSGKSNISEVATFAGPVRFRHSQRVNGHELRLAYRGLNQAAVDSIRAHFAENQGTHGHFAVPAVLWGGLSVVNEDSVYRYINSPEEDHTGLHYNVSISLRIIDGVTLRFILDCGGAVLPPVAPFKSFVFSGNEPFILDCNGASPTPTLLLDGSGAAQ
jgi:hypothetical protein